MSLRSRVSRTGVLFLVPVLFAGGCRSEPQTPTEGTEGDRRRPILAEAPIRVRNGSVVLQSSGWVEHPSPPGWKLDREDNANDRFVVAVPPEVATCQDSVQVACGRFLRISGPQKNEFVDLKALPGGGRFKTLITPRADGRVNGPELVLGAIPHVVRIEFQGPGGGWFCDLGSHAQSDIELFVIYPEAADSCEVPAEREFSN